ncbi:hypothetical protein LSTR_LSTR005989 [Laodelphax striatellus]|uniref:Checkpoint protein n=1 Tax=Laodelphax striatellus TaxID=195883 RepID=A0A482XNJ9_LAOST|nr:hypothetical protein LSTR_LSTR005989 [Laodelphax striatellus]
MKFRGKIVEPMCMRQFSSIVLTLCKLSKESVLKLTSTQLLFIISEDNAVPRRTMAWCVLDRKNFFNEYTIDGQGDNNEINLQLFMELLASSVNTFKAVDSVKSVKLKLTDKITPCLTLEIELVTSIGHSRLCVHDVPVNVITRAHAEDYAQQPPTHNYDISIEMPNLKKLRFIIDRLKKLDHFVVVSAQGSGHMCFKVETHKATVSTFFTGLKVEKCSNDLDEVSSVRVDLRKLSHFLVCEQIHPDKVTCHILNGHLIHQHLKQYDVEINYYLMAVDE